MITAGEGRYKVWFEQKKIGDNRIIILGGGEKTHIGGVVICEPDKPPRVIRLEGHYDDIVLQPLAEAACKKYHTTVVALGGVHVDNASQEEIDMLVENCRRLVACI
jgi:hypothetical protein